MNNQIFSVLVGVCIPFLAYLALTAHALQLDVAVLKSREYKPGVDPALFAQFTTETTGEITRTKEWLSRLSVRLNTLETKEKQ